MLVDDLFHQGESEPHPVASPRIEHVEEPLPMRRADAGPSSATSRKARPASSRPVRTSTLPRCGDACTAFLTRFQTTCRIRSGSTVTMIGSSGLTSSIRSRCLQSLRHGRRPPRRWRSRAGRAARSRSDSDAPLAASWSPASSVARPRRSRCRESSVLRAERIAFPDHFHRSGDRAQGISDLVREPVASCPRRRGVGPPRPDLAGS